MKKYNKLNPFTPLTESVINSMTIQNLLSHYRASFKRFKIFEHKHTYTDWVSPDDWMDDDIKILAFSSKEHEKIYYEWDWYIHLLKTKLDNLSHIEKSKNEIRQKQRG